MHIPSPPRAKARGSHLSYLPPPDFTPFAASGDQCVDSGGQPGRGIAQRLPKASEGAGERGERRFFFFFFFFFFVFPPFLVSFCSSSFFLHFGFPTNGLTPLTFQKVPITVHRVEDHFKRPTLGNEPRRSRRTETVGLGPKERRNSTWVTRLFLRVEEWFSLCSPCNNTKRGALKKQHTQIVTLTLDTSISRRFPHKPLESERQL